MIISLGNNNQEIFNKNKSSEENHLFMLKKQLDCLNYNISLMPTSDPDLILKII